MHQSLVIGRAQDHKYLYHLNPLHRFPMDVLWSPLSEICAYNREKTGNGQMTPVLRLLAGAGAGIVAMSATYPLDMVRGRLTVQEGKTGQYRGILHAARVITAEVGVDDGVTAAALHAPKARFELPCMGGVERAMVEDPLQYAYSPDEPTAPLPPSRRA